MSDYYESKIEPIIGSDNFTAKHICKSRRKKGEVRIYYSCGKCDKNAKTQKVCCGREMTKCYDL